MNKDVKKMIVRQTILNCFLVLLVFIILTGVSYSLNNDNGDNKELLIETGNMQVVINTANLKYEFKDILTRSVSDEVGMHQDGFDFSITNTGSIPIEYYEIRMVNEENKISTLPYKYLRFTISKDNGDYSPFKNLGDEQGIIYSGYNLEVGKTVKFNLKMWIDIDARNIYDKELYGAMEVTLYQKYDVYDNYVLYDSNNGSSVLKTSIYEPITSEIPGRNGYKFLGWTNDLNSDIAYFSGSTYSEKKGRTLYAKWEKISE